MNLLPVHFDYICFVEVLKPFMNQVIQQAEEGRDVCFLWFGAEFVPNITDRGVCNVND